MAKSRNAKGKDSAANDQFQGLTSDQIESAKEMTEKFQSPAIISGIILIVAAFIGFVVSAIIAAIMKKSEEETY